MLALHGRAGGENLIGIEHHWGAMSTVTYGEIVLIVMLAILIVLVGGVYFTLRRGFNQVIEALESLDERLSRR